MALGKVTASAASVALTAGERPAKGGMDRTGGGGSAQPEGEKRQEGGAQPEEERGDVVTRGWCGVGDLETLEKEEGSKGWRDVVGAD